LVETEPLLLQKNGMKLTPWITPEVNIANINIEYINQALNVSIVGKFIKPITTFFVNIERRIQRENDLQRGLVTI
jgi:hypothetical protein